MKVELIKYPSVDDLIFAKKCALNTVGKKAVNMPTMEWIEKLVKSEHSPVRTLWFAYRLEISYYVSVHLTRHKFGVEHFVQSQRDDRTNSKISRAEKPQGEKVSHIMYVNAQELINMSHRRLCGMASAETREVMQEMVKQTVSKCPYMANVLVPMCEYIHGCNEFYSCGKWKGKTNES